MDFELKNLYVLHGPEARGDGDGESGDDLQRDGEEDGDEVGIGDLDHAWKVVIPPDEDIVMRML